MVKSFPRLHLLLLWAVLFFLSCKGQVSKPPPPYALTNERLDSLIKNSDTTVLLFWTSWCGGSERINDYYQEVIQAVKANHLPVQIILVASDNDVKGTEIEKQRASGFLAYTLSAPGDAPTTNRREIKKFINAYWPEHNITQLKGFFYPVPVELLVTKNKAILNEAEPNLSFKFMCNILSRYPLPPGK